MDFVFVIGAFQAMFMALLVITKKNRSRTDIPLILYLVVTSIHFGFYVYMSQHNITRNFLSIWATGLHLLYGPFMHFYIAELILKRAHKLIWYAKHLAIFIVWGILYNLPNLVDLNFEVSVKDGFLQLTGAPPSGFILFSYTAILSGGGYSIWNLIILHRYRKKLKLNYSTIDHLNLHWISNWAYLFLFSFLIIFVASLLPVGPSFIKTSIALSVTTVVTYIGFLGYRQTNIFFGGIGEKLSTIGREQFLLPNLEESNLSSTEKTRYSKSGLSNKNSLELLNRLEEVMKVKKPYLNEDLSLYDLAKEAEVSRQILSQLINHCYEKSFYEFINGYRVKEAQSIIENDVSNNLKIAAVGFDSGFRSRSTFYKFFKKNIGVTPFEYRKRLDFSRK